MAKAKFDKLSTNSNEKLTTHADLQNTKKSRGPGAPKGARKKESAEEKITISLTKTQKEELSKYSEEKHRTVSSLIKLTLFKAGIISKV